MSSFLFLTCLGFLPSRGMVPLEALSCWLDSRCGQEQMAVHRRRCLLKAVPSESQDHLDQGCESQVWQGFPT